MTSARDLDVIAHLRDRVASAGRLPFISVDTRHLRILLTRLDELADPEIDADDLTVRSDADGVVTSTAPRDFG